MAEMLTMSWIDYLVFVLMLALSAGIGLYHGIRRNKTNTTEEYLFGGRNIPAVPIILSNMASSISTIGLILIPTETYYYGSQVSFVILGDFTSYLLLYFFFLPVFYHLKFISLFEYLEKRFNKTARVLTSVVYAITQILISLVILHSACTTLARAIPVPFFLLSSFISILCAIYTALGGLRGVVWSDTIQALFMYGSVIVIITITIINVGGVSKVIDIANKSGRLDIFNFDLNLFTRYTAWSFLLFAAFFSTSKHCTGPGIIQRHLSLPDCKTARFVALSSGISNIISLGLSIILGIVVYTAHHGCDPHLSKQMQNSDQILSYHVMTLQNQLPGLTGVFLAGILSATLSTLSTTLNSLSGVLFEDLIKHVLPTEWTNKNTNLCIKTIVMVIGLTITGGLLGIHNAAKGFELFMAFSNYTAGFIIFVFAFGLFCRKANSKSVLVAAIIGVIATVWIGTGSHNAITSGKIKYVAKIVSTEGCPANMSETLNVRTSGSMEYKTPVIIDEDVPYLYRISISLIGYVGLLVSLIIGLLVNLFTKNNKEIDESLLIPQIRKKTTVINTIVECEYTRCHLDENSAVRKQTEI